MEIPQGKKPERDDFTSVPDEIRRDFVNRLRNLLKQGTFHLETRAVEKAWVLEAVEHVPNISEFKISIEPVADSAGNVSGDFGKFYFEVIPAKQRLK